MTDPTQPDPFAPGTAPVGGPSAQSSSAGLFTALFDFSFTHFVTPKIVKAVYVLLTIALALGALLFALTGFSRGAGTGLAFLVLAAIGFIVYLALARMTLEFYVAVVRMSEDIHKRLPSA